MIPTSEGSFMITKLFNFVKSDLISVSCNFNGRFLFLHFNLRSAIYKYKMLTK